MKKRIIVGLVVAMCLVVFVGCPRKKDRETGPKRAEVVDALKKAGIDKAPTLGPVFEEFMMATYDRSYDDAWTLIDKASQSEITKELKDRVEQMEKRIPELEKELNDPQADANTKAWNQKTYDSMMKELPSLQALNGDGKKYFAMMMDKPEMSEIFKNCVEGKFEILGETVNGDKGYLSSKRKDATEPDKNEFVREDGKWKYKFFSATPEEPAAPSPTPEETTAPDGGATAPTAP